MSKVDSNYTCLAVINVNFAFKNDKIFYLQEFLKQCKYIEKEVIRHIIEERSKSFFSWVWWWIFFPVTEGLKKFQKHEQFLLGELFISL